MVKLVAILSILGVTRFIIHSQNLVENGGFDQGLRGWKIKGGNIKLANEINGSKKNPILMVELNKKKQSFYREYEFKEGMEFVKITFKVKTSEDFAICEGTQNFLELEFLNKLTCDEYAYWSPEIKRSMNWVEKSDIFKINKLYFESESQTKPQFGIILHAGVGKIYFDDFRVEPASRGPY
ncbi:MAG: hypothetical protein R3F23_01925 [Verrucomicrobiia bacterium]